MFCDSSQHVWASARTLTTTCLRISIVLGTKYTTRNLLLCFIFSLSCFLHFHPYLLVCRFPFVWGVQNWWRHCTTRRKAAGSIPDGVTRIFSLTWSFRPDYDPTVGSASNGNEYQEHLLESKGGRCLWLTTLPPSCSDCLEILRVSTTYSPQGLFSPKYGLFYFSSCEYFFLSLSFYFKL